MVTDKRKIARRVAIGYVLLGSAFFLLWHFVISPAGYVDPLLIALFYISLPAVLASPYVIYEVVAEVINARIKRIETSEETSD